MKIGVPKEIKNHEYRVGMTPSSVREATAHGHSVMVQTNAGEGIGASMTTIDPWALPSSTSLPTSLRRPT